MSSGVLLEKIYSKYSTNYLEQLTVASQPDWDNKDGLIFNDTDERIVSNVITELSFGTNDFEIGLWVEVGSGTDQTIFEIPDCISLIYNPTGASNKFRFILSDASTPNLDSVNTYSAGRYYVSIIRKDDDFYLLVNLIIDNTYNEASVDFQASTNVFCLGNDHTTDSLNLDGNCDLLTVYTEDDVFFNPKGYVIVDRIGQLPSRYSGNFTPQKDIINLDTAKGGIFTSTGILIDKWRGNNSRNIAYSIAGKEPDHDLIENAAYFNYTNNEFLKIDDPDGLLNVSETLQVINFKFKRNGNNGATAGMIAKALLTGGANASYQIFIDSSNFINARIYNATLSSTSISTVAITDTTWHEVYVLLQKSGITTTVTLVLDGIIYTSAALDNVNESTNPMFIGGYPDSSVTVIIPFEGYISKVKFYKK